MPMTDVTLDQFQKPVVVAADDVLSLVTYIVDTSLGVIVIRNGSALDYIYCMFPFFPRNFERLLDKQLLLQFRVRWRKKAKREIHVHSWFMWSLIFFWVRMIVRRSNTKTEVSFVRCVCLFVTVKQFAHVVRRSAYQCDCVKFEAIQRAKESVEK